MTKQAGAGTGTSPGSGSGAGLGTSIWAPFKPRPNYNNKASYQPHYPSTSNAHDQRSRSVPPPAQQQQHPSTPAIPGTTPLGTRISSTLAAPLTPSQALHRFEQACQRLRWKSLDLESSYKRAMAPEEWAFSAADAERNFKVDFYEFYAWIEQAVVLLLLVFSVTIPREKVLVGGSAAHAYHHNVLRALDDEESPLHAVLGTGDVNQALWKAKELRNRWKDAADGKETPPLKMYDLAWVVGEILAGLDRGYALARDHVSSTAASDTENGGMRDGDATAVEEGWDWMVEAMDWEA
ncbi:hypothetical protein K4F52_009296 [Lecanicillium sp. MT-2017a]|nr:hypothetical protein K4F52_009296 [Lecanicillium sp. MT-2017a]